MCGISVALGVEAGADVRPALGRMHDAIPHRGPDGDGFLLLGWDGGLRLVRSRDDLATGAPARLGLGFRWLKVQDADEAAAQPMASADGSTWIVFNGEIYNHDALRAELRDRGHRFRTGSDTEVLLEAWLEWGSGCFARFNGMWAVVIVDAARSRIVLGRDRFGIKPLFHARRGARFLLASETKQILAASGAAVAPRAGAVTAYLKGLRSHLGEDTFFEGIQAMPPATWAELPLRIEGDREPALQSYWDLAEFACPEPVRAPAFPDACRRLEELLVSAVDLERRACVPVGNLLSGGLDSSLLASLCAELQQDPETPARAVSLVFGPDHEDIDESPFVDDVVRHRSLVSDRVSMDAAWVRESLGRVCQAQEEPPAGLAVLGQYRVFERAAEARMRVVLDGQGADELFAGYPRHQDALLLDRLLAGRVVALGREARALRAEQPGFLRGFVERTLLSRIRGRFRPRVYDWLRPAAPGEVRADPAPTGRDPSRLNRVLHRDVTGHNLKAVLAITDRNAMAHSIEARVPYLDHRVVEFAFGLPDHYKAGAGQRKRVLREVARGHLPASILARRDKIGFGTPEREWIRGELQGPVRTAAAALGQRFPALLDADRLAAFVAGFYAGDHDDFRAVWRCYALHAWAEAYGVSGL